MQLSVHYEVKLVHKGDIVTVEGEIMHSPSARALSVETVTTLSESTN